MWYTNQYMYMLRVNKLNGAQSFYRS
jgi:hypothetical protein